MMKKQINENNITTETFLLSIYTEKSTNFTDVPAFTIKTFPFTKFSISEKLYKNSSDQSLLSFSVTAALSMYCESKYFQGINLLNANQLTGFYMRATLPLNGLNSYLGSANGLSQ